VRSALEWAQVLALAADGVSQREIAARLGINRRTVARLAAADEPPRYERAGQGSMLDPLEVVIGGLMEEWPQIKAPRVTEILRDDYGYAGSIDLVRKRMAAIPPREVRPPQPHGLSAGAGGAGRLGRDADPPADRGPRAPRLRPCLRAALLRRVDGALQLRHDDRVVPAGPRPSVRVVGWGSARVRLRQLAIGGRAA
jgi:transcriptional regulator with XRE-family HTH domain